MIYFLNLSILPAVFSDVEVDKFSSDLSRVFVIELPERVDVMD